MNTLTGFPLLLQQFKVLFLKNLLLAWRNKTVTFFQLFSSFIFILLLFCVQKGYDVQTMYSTAYQRVTDPQPLVSPPIPPCDDKLSIRTPCYDFVWSGDQSSRIRSIVGAIMANNPNRPIPANKVKSFRTPDEVDAWLYKNPMCCPGALHFVERNSTVISYGLQINLPFAGKLGNFDDDTIKIQIPLQIAAEREIARSLIGDLKFSWTVALKEFAHPAMEKLSAVDNVYGTKFLLAPAMFGFVFQMTSLITEKELKLRQAMTMMGLYDSAYWFSWLVWEGLITLLSSLFTVLFGMMFQFKFFLNNSFAVVYLVFYLFQLNMIGFAFMLSAFIKKSSSTTTVGFVIFLVASVTQLVGTDLFYSKGVSRTKRSLWSLFPPNLLSQALNILNKAASNSEETGISWSRRANCGPWEEDCVITINDIYVWLVATFFLWFILAIYLDNIIPNVSGVRKSVYYFLNPGYWIGIGGNKVEDGGICSCTGSLPPVEHITPDDEDVLEEENIVKEQTKEGAIDPNIAVQIRGLVKTYPGKSHGCCCRKRTAPYRALKGLWVNFAKDQLFCLLGPNGAGKTTAINCLTGITPVTGGDALIYGHSARSSVGMANIRKMIGVCPQFDILWDALSGQEHLHIFASIQGLPPASVKSVTMKSLEEVKLTDAAKVRAGSYSGGMKRRLSVAIALIGDPKLVILDEPTTGMDPISRRHVWDIIDDAKKGRAIVLTTHSMEEADILGDRIGIMAKGRLRCIGTSIRLKSRFGTGFIANVRFKERENEQGLPPPNGDEIAASQHEAVKQLFKYHLDVSPKEETKSYLSFVIPYNREDIISKFFKELQDREDEFGIADIQLGLATLEEVFLNIARKAELESATAEGRLVTLTLTSGVLLQIPVGARFVGIPGTESTENPNGLMIEVFWEQDDSGSLCISGHSPETPTPPNIAVELQPHSTSHRTKFGRFKPVNGIVLNSDQITQSIGPNGPHRRTGFSTADIPL